VFRPQRVTLGSDSCLADPQTRAKVSPTWFAKKIAEMKRGAGNQANKPLQTAALRVVRVRDKPSVMSSVRSSKDSDNSCVGMRYGSDVEGDIVRLSVENLNARNKGNDYGFSNR
jgi:sensor domain CHASE-containing protein